MMLLLCLGLFTGVVFGIIGTLNKQRKAIALLAQHIIVLEQQLLKEEN